jgi:hypothetical protein
MRHEIDSLRAQLAIAQAEVAVAKTMASLTPAPTESKSVEPTSEPAKPSPPDALAVPVPRKVRPPKRA